jgi:hypothetical protein
MGRGAHTRPANRLRSPILRTLAHGVLGQAKVTRLGDAELLDDKRAPTVTGGRCPTTTGASRVHNVRRQVSERRRDIVPDRSGTRSGQACRRQCEADDAQEDARGLAIQWQVIVFPPSEPAA